MSRAAQASSLSPYLVRPELSERYQQLTGLRRTP